ncbi:MAG: hypothetical protein EBU70_14135, partial [Actinobacteria bacterium]|nr:hypothetical protein [Actinomycetota bacterium]
YGDVYVKGVDERSPFVRVTRSPSRERDIAWMPDGAKLLFSSDMDGGDSIYEATVLQTRGEIRAAFKEKTEPKKEEPKKEEPAPAAAPASPEAAAPAADAAPAGAPAAEKRQDDKKDEEKNEKKDEKKDEGARWADAVKVEVKPSIADRAVSERAPSPSPDGTKVAYRRGHRALVVRDVATGEEKALRDGFDTEISWRWSPDGRMIAFRQDDDDFNSDIWIVPSDGSAAPVNVSRHPDPDANPRWSADGKVLAFASARVDNEADVYMVFLDKSLDGLQRFELDQYFKDAGEAAKKKAAERGKKAEAKKPEAKKPDAAKDGDAKPADANPDAKKEEKPEERKPDEKKPEPAKLDLDDAYLRLRRLTTMPGDEFDLEIAPAGDRVYFMGGGGDAA